MTFSIDPEFAELCPPLTHEERNLLMASIEREGCREPLIVWEQEGLLLDGHNRHAICEELGVTFTVSQKAFPDRAAAIDWIVMNQLGRRNLPEEQKAHLRGMRYRNEKKKPHRPEKGVQSEHLYPQKTAERLAEELGVSATTIRRDAEYSEAVDAIGKNVGKAAKAEILSGKSGLTRGRVVEIAQQPADDQSRVFEAAKQGVPPAPEKVRERKADDPCEEIIGELCKLTKSPSLIAPYSEIKRLVAELREAYRKQHGRK